MNGVHIVPGHNISNHFYYKLAGLGQSRIEIQFPPIIYNPIGMLKGNVTAGQWLAGILSNAKRI